MPVLDLDDYRWLVGNEAEPWLEEAARSLSSLVALAGRLRKSLSPERAHLILEQVDLRRRAKEKFAAAGRMFFTPRGLEQATDEIVAGYKASRFPAGACVADLCCGIGGDLLALARRGPVLAVDRDPIAALLAEVNCTACGLAVEGPQAARVLTADAADAPLEPCSAAHLDPDRRPAGRRTTQMQYFEPGPEQIEQLLLRIPDLALKLAPATQPPESWYALGEWEWISRGGQCRQLVAWFGSLAQRAGSRRASLLGADARPLRTIIGTEGLEAPRCDRIGRYLYEPDAAVLAAGLEGALAAEYGLHAIESGIAYLTGDAALTDPALAAFEIEELLPFDIKQLRGLLAQRGIGRLEIKKRGVPRDPEQIRAQLALRGASEATLILTRHKGHIVALLGRRLSSST